VEEEYEKLTLAAHADSVPHLPPRLPYLSSSLRPNRTVVLHACSFFCCLKAHSVAVAGDILFRRLACAWPLVRMADRLLVHLRLEEVYT
jgi:hypothetical protein